MSNITITQLQKADIIVCTGNSVVSKAIRTATGADVSHAILYAGNSQVIESLENGPTGQSWDLSQKGTTLAIALRYRGLTSKQADDIVTFASGFLGKDIPYDKIGAVGSGMIKRRGAAISAGMVAGGCLVTPILCSAIIGGKAITDANIVVNASDANKDTAFFCSELVARSFQLAGLSLVDGVEPSYLNPGEVRNSSKLDYVGHLIGG